MEKMLEVARTAYDEAREGGNHEHDALKFAIEAIARLREPAGVPDGWVLVPREPTEAMYHAAESAIRAAEIDTPQGKLVREPTRVRYTAMLAAAPQPPAEAQDKWKALIGKWQQRAERLAEALREAADDIDAGITPEMAAAHLRARAALNPTAAQEEGAP